MRRRRLVRMVVFGFETWSPSRRLVVRALIANRSIFLPFFLFFLSLLCLSLLLKINTQAPQIDPFLSFLADDNPNSTKAHLSQCTRIETGPEPANRISFVPVCCVYGIGSCVDCGRAGLYITRFLDGREKRARFGRLHFSRPRSNRGLRITKMRLVIDAGSHDTSKRGAL